MSSIEEQDAGMYLLEQADEHGIACATVSDGHVLVFTTATLEDLLEKSRKAGKAVVFVKRGAVS